MNLQLFWPLRNSLPLNVKNRGAELFISIFQNFLKRKNIHHYSRFTDKRTSIVERVIRTLRNLMKKPVFLARHADWISEIPSVIKKVINTIHSSTKMPPIQASKKTNAKEIYSNLREDREKQTPKLNLGQLIRTADIKRVFVEGDSINWSYKLCAITEVIHDTIPSYRIDYLPDRYIWALVETNKSNN